MKKYSLVLIALVIMLSSIAKAEEAPEKESAFDVNGKLTISAPYVSEPTGERGTGGVTTLTSVTITHKKTKIYLNALAIVSEKNATEEIDICLGKTTEVNGATIDVGVSVYDIKRLGNMDDNLLAFYAGVEFPKIFEITPFIYLEADVPINDSYGKGGILWNFGAKKTFEVAKHPVEVKVTAGGSNGIYGSDPMPVSFVRATTSIELEFHGFKYSPFISLQKGFGGIAEDVIVIGVNIYF